MFAHLYTDGLGSILENRLNGHFAKEQLAPKRFAPNKTIGVGGTATYSGYIESKEKDSRLSGTNRYTTFSEILSNISIVATGARHVTRLITKAAWTFEPSKKAKSQAEAEDVAEFVDEVLHDMVTPWHRVVRRAAMHSYYGFAIAEWTAKRREDGRVGFLDVDTRPQHTIEQWDIETGEFLGVGQRSPQDGSMIWIPRGKLLYLVDDSLSDSPEGMGIFRHLVEPATRLERFHQLEGWGFETDLRGIPIGRVPLAELDAALAANTITQAQYNAYIAPMDTFLKHHIKGPKLAQMLDSSVYATTDERQSPSNVKKWDIELLKAGNTSQAEIANAIQRINQEMARLLGVEHLLLGSDGTGSLALSQDKSKNIALLIDSSLVEIREAVKADLVKPLLRMNGIDDDLCPELRTETAQWRDIQQVTAAIRDMATAGAVLAPDDPAIAVVFNMLGLPAPKPMELTGIRKPEAADPVTDDEDPESDDMAGSPEARAEEVAT